MKTKIGISILIIGIIFCSLAMMLFKSMASTTANIVVDTKEAILGKEVEVNINLENSTEFSAANFVLTYDNSILEYKSYLEGEVFEDASSKKTNGKILLNDNKKGEIKIGYISNPNQSTETKVAGKMLTLVFQVKTGLGTSTDIKLEATTLKKQDGTNVKANIINGKLDIIAEQQEEENIGLNKNNLTLPIHQTRKLTIKTDKTIKWSSSDENIVSIDQNGVITALKEGTARIFATVGNQTLICKVVVSGTLGDIDRDGKITSNDAYKALENSVNSDVGIDINEYTFLLSDTNKNEFITAQDAYKILKYSVKMIDKF